MKILTESETTINQNNIFTYIGTDLIENVSAYLSTVQNNMNGLFGISLFQNQLQDFTSLGDSGSYSTHSPSLKLNEQLHYDPFQNNPKSNVSKEKIWGESKFYVESLQNYLTFSESDKKINNTRLDFDDYLNISPIVLPVDFMSSDEQLPLRQTIQKPRLDDILLKIPQKFDVCDIAQLRNFISIPKILEIPNLPERLDKIIYHVSSFMNKLGHEGKSKIDVFSDEEIENFQSITIEYVVKNATSDQCIQWTESLVSEIIAIDENMLNIIQVEIIPDDV